MSVIDDLKKQIDAGRISFDKPSLKDELLGSDVTADLQALVNHLSTLEKLKISSIVRQEGHHKAGRAFDVGNETIAKSLLPKVATDAEVATWKIDEIIFDAKVADGSYDRNKWNYDRGAKHAYDSDTLDDHADHIHFAVKAPAKPAQPELFIRALQPQGGGQAGIAAPTLSPVGGLVPVDFKTYPAGHVMPPAFAIAGIGFESMGLGGRLMVIGNGAEKGLQFTSDGLRVTLRRPVNGLLLSVGSFATPLTITARDPAGVVVHQQTLTPTQVILRVLLNAPGTRTLEFTEGNGEGRLVELVIPD